MPDEAAQLYFWQPGDERPLYHKLIHVRVVDGTIIIPSLPNTNTRMQVCVRGEGGRLRNVDPSAMSVTVSVDLIYGVSARIKFDQTVVRDGTEVFIELVDGEEMLLCWQGWADDVGEEDAGCPDYDSFMSVLD